ncbi:hypothetical protein LCGC14_3034390, partial [marine sediment metagenome]
MIADWLKWLWGSGGGWTVRVAAGVGIFTALAIVDLRRHGRGATRWKEYLFLLACVAGTIAYAFANDMVTVTISPTYYLVHEGLPPDTPNVRAVAAIVAIKGASSVGLLLGAALLIANNPRKRKHRPQLSYRQLAAKMGYPLAGAVVASVVLGVPTALGWVDGLFGVTSAAERSFACVLQIHLAAYVGGGLGGMAAVVSILRRRRKLPRGP